MKLHSRLIRILGCLRQSHSLVADKVDLSGKTFLVTGGSSGIGAEVVRGLFLNGADVIIACRNLQKAKTLRNAIYQQADKSTFENSISIFADTDTSDLDSIAEFFKRFKTEQPLTQLDGLILNAGVANLDYQLSKQGYELHCATNVLGHHLLVKKCLPLLAKSADARVIHVTGDIYALTNTCTLNTKYKYFNNLAYARSKLGVMWNTFNLDKHKADLGAPDIKSIVVHPGVVATDLIAGMNYLKNKFLISAQQGAQSILYAASSADVGSGDYIHNVHKFFEFKIGDPALNTRAAEKFWHACDHAIVDYVKKIKIPKQKP